MKIAIVGSGGIGSVHARHASRLPGVEVLTLDTEAAKAEALANSVGGHAVELRHAIADADAAIVCVPTDFHMAAAAPFLEAGKHVLIEKPLARTVAEVSQLEPYAAQIAVGQVVRYFCDHRQVHNIIKSGRLGKPAAARLRRSGGKPRNWNAWFADLNRSGGVLVDLAVHDFDWLRWTIGEVESVFACSAKANSPELDGDFALATLKMRDGAVCHSESSWMDYGFRTSIEVSGPEGCVEVDSRLQPSLRIDGPEGTQMASPMDPSDDPYFLQLRDFVQFVQGKPSDIATFRDGREALRISLAALESAKTGETVDL